MDIDIVGQITDLFHGITIMTPDMGAMIALFMALLLLLCSGFVSGSEIAFFSLTPNDLLSVEEEKHKSDTKISQLRDDSERLLATILITNNFVNVAIIMLFNFFFSKVIDFGINEVMEFVFMTVILTFLLLLFGEIMPKIYSTHNTLKYSRFAAPIFIVLLRVFRPFSSLLVRSKRIATKVVQKETHPISVDELEQALELTDKEEIAEEQEILEGIIRFGGKMAREIMTPRMDVVDLDVKTPFKDVLKCVLENNYSRIPVYSDTIDNVKGILYIKDLLPHLDKTNFRWQTLIRPPYFVPETKMIDDLLRDFQTNKVHIAVVVDEFGGTSGIVTMEDIIEEIVGDIRDEYDEDESPYVKLSANSYMFEAKVLLTDFCKILDIDDDIFSEVEGDAETLAGLLLELKGEFPHRHEILTYQHFTFEVLEVDDRRIQTIKVTIEEQDNTEEKP